MLLAPVRRRPPSPIRWSRFPVVPSVLVAIAAIAVTVLLGNFTARAAVALTAVAVLTAWMFVSKRYTLTLAAYGLYLGLADGYLKLRTGSSYVTLGRDLLLFAIVAGVVLRYATRRSKIEVPPFTGVLAFFVAYVVAQVMNPHGGSMLGAIPALRPHLAFVPLFFVGYYAVRSRERLQGLILLLAVIAAVNGVVSYVQFNLSPTQLASWGPGYYDRLHGKGSLTGRAYYDEGGLLRTRPFGLGGDTGAGGVAGMLGFPAACALLVLRRRRAGFGRVLAPALIAGAGLAIVTSQSRSALVAAAVMVAGYALLAAVSRRSIATFLVVAVSVLGASALLGALAGSAGSGALDRYRTVTPSSVVSTVVESRGTALGLVPEYIKRFPFGAGLGSGGPATRQDLRPELLDAETQFNFLVIELGLPGLLFVFGFSVAIIGLAFIAIRRAPPGDVRLMLAAIAAPLVGLLVTWVSQTYLATSPAAPYYWLSSGVLAYWCVHRSGRRDQIQAAEAATEQQPQPERS